MKRILIQVLPLAGALCLFTGCAAVTRTTTDVGLGAGGAAIGAELSHNNPSARLLGVSRATLWRMTKAGLLQKIEVLPGSFRLRRSDLEAIAAGQ